MEPIYVQSSELDQFCNWYPASFYLDAQRWSSVEHYFQAQKFLESVDIREKIRRLPSAQEARSLGASSTEKVREDWLEARVEVMKKALTAKFSQNPFLETALLETGFAPFVLQTTNETFWGCGNGENGQNVFGTLLMEVRKDLRTDLPPCKRYQNGQCNLGSNCRFRHIASLGLFDQLPKETLKIIFSSLSVASKLKFTALCQTFRKRIRALAPPAPSFSQPIPSDLLTFFKNPTQFYNHSKHSISNEKYFRGPILNFSIAGLAGLAYCLIVRSPTFSRSSTPVVLNHDGKIQISNSDYISNTLNQPVICQIVCYNTWAVSYSDEFRYTTWNIEKPRPRDNYCFEGPAKVLMFNGDKVQCSDIQIGDIVMSSNGQPTKITKIKTTPHNKIKEMVKIDDFLITRGHPVFVNGDWYRPDELFSVREVWVDTVYNFVMEPLNDIFVGENSIQCSTLGSLCPRLVALDPVSDALYGSGYGTGRALRYSWLLSLEKRIPDDQVEAETDKYWNSFYGTQIQ